MKFDFLLLAFRGDDYRGKTVVDVGCGLSGFVDTMNRVYGANASGVDIIFHPEFGKDNQSVTQEDHKEMMQLAARNGIDLSRRIGASATNLPYEDASVDAVVATVSIDYLPPAAYRRSLQKILRVLKPGGKAFLNSEANQAAPILEAWGIPYKLYGGVSLVLTKPGG